MERVRYLADAPPPGRAERIEQSRDVLTSNLTALFDIGYKMAREGYTWEHVPPGVQAGGTGS